MSMKVIKPIMIGDSSLTSCSVAETDYAAWAAGTAYAVNDKAIRVSTHRVYTRLVAGTTATAPEFDATNWKDTSPTNRWAMFDTMTSTATTAANSISVVLAPGRIGGIYLGNLVGSSLSISITNGPAGPVVYSSTTSLEGRDVFNWYDWYFADFYQVDEVVFTDIPPYTEGVITVTVTGPGAVAIGSLVVGQVTVYGDVQYGADTGIVDYSKKETDSFGVTTFIPRAYSKRSNLQMMVAKEYTPRVISSLTKLRATPAVYIGSSDASYTSLVVYGFYRSWRNVISYPTQNLISIELEGLA